MAEAMLEFNKNIIDPIKMIFDKTVYQSTWEEIVSNEIFRQRDKSNNNDIGYFHQRIFQYIADCHVPDNGKEGGWLNTMKDLLWQWQFIYWDSAPIKVLQKLQEM